MRILVVDDDEYMIEKYASCATNLGNEVLKANNGSAARRFLRDEGLFSAVITDMQMPGCSGLELIQSMNRMRL